MKKEYPKAEEILRLLAGGAVLTGLILSPHLTLAALHTIKLFHDWERYPRFQLKRTIDRLRKRKLVTIVEKNNETIIELTDLGHKEILHYDINNLKIAKPKQWNRDWWMVIFDIPNFKKRERDLFRAQLKRLGFYFIQESVSLYPYDCRKEIEFLREVYSIKKYVNLLVVKYFEEEYRIKSFFGLG